MRVFIVGNGKSREGFDLNRLLGKGKIVGCNEAYKTFPHFDMVASIDTASTKEIRKNYEGLHIYKAKNHWFRSDLGKNLGTVGDYNNTGLLATRAVTVLMDPAEIYLLGVDFGGGRVFDDRITAAPTNTTWRAWQSLMGGWNIIRVGNYSKQVPLNIIKNGTQVEPGYLDNDIISYRELDERIYFWERGFQKEL